MCGAATSPSWNAGRSSGQPIAADLDDAGRALEHRLARLAGALESRSSGPLCVYLDEGEAAGTFARFIAGAAPTARVLVVAATRAPLDAPFAAAIELPPLGPEDVAALLAAGLGHERARGKLQARSSRRPAATRRWRARWRAG